MNTKELKEEVVNALEQMESYKVKYIWNEYCCNYDYFIYDMDEFNEIFYGKKPLEVAEMLEYGDFNSGDEYFAFDGLANIETFNALDDYSMFSYDELADYLVDNEEVLNKDFGVWEYLEDEVVEAIENEEITEE